MKKLNNPEYYPRYYATTDHPEIIEVENANFISILAKESLDFTTGRSQEHLKTILREPVGQ